MDWLLADAISFSLFLADPPPPPPPPDPVDII